MYTAVEALSAAANVVHSSVQSHKRAEAFHRRQIRKGMAELERLRSLCEQHGITLEITDKAPEGGEVDNGIRDP